MWEWRVGWKEGRGTEEEPVHLPLPSSSKQPKAFLITSSGSVPVSFSPNIVRNMVKFIGPGASLIICSKYLSVTVLPAKSKYEMKSQEITAVQMMK